MSFEKAEKRIEDNIDKVIARLEKPKVIEQIPDLIDLAASVAKPEDLKKLIEAMKQYPKTRDILIKKWETLIYSSRDCSVIFDSLFECDEIKEQLIKQLPKIFANANVKNGSSIAKSLLTMEDGVSIVVENFESIVRTTKTGYDIVYLAALENPDGRKKIKERFFTIKDSAPLGEFFNFIRGLKEIEGFEKEYDSFGYWAELYNQIQIPSPDTISKGRAYKHLNYDEQIKYGELYTANILKQKIFFNLMYEKTRFEKEMILKDVAEEEGYEYYSAGSTSLVLKTGDRIVKLGTCRNQFKIPYHPRILMPWFRKEYGDGTTLEVFNHAIDNDPSITDERVLEIYKELESAGILWSDARRNNLVVLKKDNDLPDFIASKEFNVFGFLEDAEFPTTNHIPLKAGDIVICDLDLLFTKDDPNYTEGRPADNVKEYMKKSKKQSRDENFYYR